MDIHGVPLWHTCRRWAEILACKLSSLKLRRENFSITALIYALDWFA
jgi:hypothetical protein